MNQVKGLREMDRTFARLEDVGQSREVSDSIFGLAVEMQNAMRARVHNVTGNLSGAIEAVRATRSERVKAFVRVDRARAPHAHLVEFGTSGPRTMKKKRIMFSRHEGKFYGREVGPMPKRPFFRPVANRYVRNRSAYLGAVGFGVNKAIKRVVG